MCPARILVADDHDCVRQGLRSIIQQHVFPRVAPQPVLLSVLRANAKTDVNLH